MERVLKAVLKLGLKAVAPVVGELAVDLAEAGASDLLDARQKSKAADVAGRILVRVRSDAGAWLAKEGLAPEAVEPLYATIEAVAGDSDRLTQSWTRADFDPQRAADLCLADNTGLTAHLSEGERALCRMLLTAVFTALVAEQKALEATEAEFRRAVLERLTILSQRVSALSEQDHARLSQAVAMAALSLRSLRWQADLLPPGALLRADIDDPVPFHGRERELQDLMDWCETPAALSARLYTGAGGIGKTRLLREVARRLQAKAWRAGFLDSTAAVDTDLFWTAVCAGPEHRLYVIDYAENRRPQVVQLLRELLAAAASRRRRVVLLARAADEWWERLQAEASGVGELLSGPGTAVVPLGPHTSSIDDRHRSFTLAASHFARKLRRSAPGQAPQDLGDEAYARPLLLHMAALAAVEDVQVQGDQGVLNYVLRRERRFWEEHAAARGLPAHLARGIGRAMAVFTLAGGAAGRDDAVAIIKRIPFFADQTLAVVDTLAELLHDIYPGERWIEPVLPDLLGEHLCQVELDENPDELLALVLDGATP